MAINDEKEKTHEDYVELRILYFIWVLGALYYQWGYIGWVGEVQNIKNAWRSTQSFHHIQWWNASWDVQTVKEANQQNKSLMVQEVDQLHIDGKIDDVIHSNELQFCGIDPPRHQL
jgi:hypothetical protein